MGMKMGFTFTEVKRLTMGKWTDYFETYKKVYNFETKRCLYEVAERKKVSVLTL